MASRTGTFLFTARIPARGTCCVVFQERLLMALKLKTHLISSTRLLTACKSLFAALDQLRKQQLFVFYFPDNFIERSVGPDLLFKPPLKFVENSILRRL